LVALAVRKEHGMQILATDRLILGQLMLDDTDAKEVS
jgi:hypothetical protein